MAVQGAARSHLAAPGANGKTEQSERRCKIALRLRPMENGLISQQHGREREGDFLRVHGGRPEQIDDADSAPAQRPAFASSCVEGHCCEKEHAAEDVVEVRALGIDVQEARMKGGENRS